MSHLSVELKQNYAYEHIDQWEHNFVRDSCVDIGFDNTAATRGVAEHLPRAEYFSEGGTYESVKALHSLLEDRLKRKVKIEVTLGISYGFGLEPVVRSLPDPWESLLSAPQAPTGYLGLFESVSATNPASYSSLFDTVSEVPLTNIGLLAAMGKIK